MSFFSSLVYPAYCIYCNRLIEQQCAFCDKCSEQLPPIVPVIQKISATLSMTVHAAGGYDGILARLVHAKDSGDQKSAHLLSYIMRHYAHQYQLAYDAIIPIPLHWFRYVQRGYNQAEAIAHLLPAVVGGDLVQPFMRWRATDRQRLLSASERNKNVRGAFVKKPWISQSTVRNLICGKRVVLIDDVYTTGSTLGALASVIARYEPSTLDAFVVCRVL